MNFRLRSMPEPGGFQIAPMVDIVFLLLIFFLTTWSFARYETELEIVVPSAKEGKDTRRGKGEIILNVRADGVVLLNRKPLTASELKESLEKVAVQYPDQAVILRGDENVSYKEIVTVLDICRAANIWNVAFATTKPK